MWYFAWMLGVGFAVLLSILNAMWNEAQEDRAVIVNGGGSTHSADLVYSSD